MDELCYCSPAYGGYGLMNLGMQVPESFILFVGPPSCGRHSAIGSIQKNNKKRNGYLFVTEEEIALGTVEGEIYRAVDEILSSKDIRPKAFILLFSCIIFLIGMDEKIIMNELSKKHPGIVFQVYLMNPISIGTKHAPITMMYSRMAEMFDLNSEQNDSLNFIGNNVPIDKSCEIYDVLKKCCVEKTNHTMDMKTYEEFRSMGSAKWNLVIKPEGLRAAKELHPRMDYRFLMTSYDLNEIRAQYEEIFSMLGKRCDIDHYEKRARASIKRTSELFKGRTVALGSSASYKTFGLARMLIENGFQLTDIFNRSDIYKDVPPFDSKDYAWVKENRPEIRIHSTCGTEMIHNIGKCCKADVVIGFNAAYFSETECIVDIVGDERLFGYRGIEMVMESMEHAIRNPRDLKELMNDYGIVV